MREQTSHPTVDIQSDSKPAISRDHDAARTVVTPNGEVRPLLEHFRRVRGFTETLAEPLEIEDYVVQTVENVSPTKWHLAHTTWFFEVFVLQRFKKDYQLYHPEFPYLFNSYYVQAGERHCRDRRGYISRPTVREVYDYRAHVNAEMQALLEGSDSDAVRAAAEVVEIGIHHEQQHQELILTDIKHVLSVNPLRPVYRAQADRGSNGHAHQKPLPLAWRHFSEGIYEIGHAASTFCYDNELPRHRHFAEEFLLANRLVSCGEYLAFMMDGGYERPELWLSEGWATVEANEWTEPFYWEKRDGRWWMFTLSGMREVDEHEPVCHLSYFEADAFARWADARLPTEQEWEIAARAVGALRGNFVEEGRYHPAAAGAVAGDAAEAVAGSAAEGAVGSAAEAAVGGAAETTDAGGDGAAAAIDTGTQTSHGDIHLEQMYGDVWEWTRSQYSPYPGYKPLPGALGEYNGKFMCNQFVLRGGSCATSVTHIRPTYRNFFSPESTWQFTGLRLARDV